MSIDSWIELSKQNPYYYILKDEKYDITKVSIDAITPEIVKSGNKFYNYFLNKQKLYRITNLTDILDYGCGFGRDSIYLSLANNDSKIEAIDSSPEYIKLLTKYANLLNLQNISSGQEYDEGKQFDLILCNEVLPYMNLELQKQYISKLLSSVKLHGFMFVTMLVSKDSYTIVDDITNLTMYRHNSIDSIQRLFEENGCKLLEHDIDSNMFIIKRFSPRKIMKNVENFINVRQDVPIKNKLNIIQEGNNDYHVVAYYNNVNSCDIIVRRLDEDTGWDKYFDIEIQSMDGTKNERIVIPISHHNELVIKNVTLSNVELEKVDLNLSQNIPKHIVQTMDDNKMSLMHWNTIQTILELNPEYSYTFFSAPARRAFIKENYDEDVLDTYDGFVAGAFQADLFRYCYLYKNGGCYIDCKMINRIPLRNVIDTDCKFMVTKDRINNAYQNNVIFTEAKNDALKSAIDLCVKRFKERFMKRVPCGSLYHTGPFLFYDACHSYMDNEKNKVGLYFDAPFNNDDYRQYHLKSINNNDVIFNTIYNGYYKQYNSVHKKPIWSEQWAKGEVYYTNKRVVGDKTIYVYPNPQNKDGPNKEYEFKMDYQTGELMLDCETKNTDGVMVKVIDDKNNKCSSLNIMLSEKISPISFAYPTNKFIKNKNIQNSDQKIYGFSYIIPGITKYSFDNEDAYNSHYSKCLFALTFKKGGWDCFRHYEIIAAGAIPYFVDIDDMPVNIMTSFPKQLVKQAMQLPGVPSKKEIINCIQENKVPVIDIKQFNYDEYFKLRRQILQFFESRCLTKCLAHSIIDCKKPKIVQIMSPISRERVDYLREFLVISLLENDMKVITNHNIDYYFEDYENNNVSDLYGRGVNYMRCLSSKYKCNTKFSTTIDNEADIIIFTTASNNPRLSIDDYNIKENVVILEVDGNDIGFQRMQKHINTKMKFIREWC